MKKLAIIPMLLALAITLSACGGGAAQQEPLNLPSPVEEYGSLSDINEVAGTNLEQPGAMGVSDERFAVIDCDDYLIAEYDFTLGREYTFRGARNTFEDISGIYIDGKTAYDGKKATDTIDYVTSKDVKVARWKSGDVQYVLATIDEGEMDQSDFESVAEEMQMITE